MVHGLNQDEYGIWLAVALDTFIFGLFSYSAFRPQTKRDWRTWGVFMAFLVALFSEMFGFPLTIYILTSILGSRYPALDPFSHYNGHIWVVLLGDSPVLFNIVHLLSNLLIFAGLLVITVGWRGIYSGEGRLVTDGIYRYIRHPQYSGFMLMIIGFLIQWPTIITLIMAPILMVMYTKLAKKEEKVMIETFGDLYSSYMNRVPRFVPKIIHS